MYKEHRVHVVIPCFNVVDRAGEVIAGIPSFVDGIVAVDDGSTDGTSELLDRLSDGRLRVLHHERNRGVGAAMVTGLQCAAEEGADILVKIDGDGQMDVRYLPELLEALVDGYDYAKGNRLLDQRALAAMPRARLFGNFALTFLTKLASGYWHILDSQNGFVAIRRPVWEALDSGRIANGYFFENDMLVHLNILNARVKDIPMPARYQGERSNLRVGRIVPSFTWLLVRRTVHRFFWKYVLRDFSPIALFVFAGLPLFLWGIIFGAWAWWDHARQNIVTPTGTVMISVLPLLLGFQLLLQALVLDIQESPR
jgi:glycosyltransferase involved in cell wall biosynthesis